MMTLKAYALIFSTALAAVSYQNDSETETYRINEIGENDSAFSTKFETQVKKIFLEKELFGDFVFAVVDENGLAYSFVLNRDILEGKESSLDIDSPLYIASHTKSFTGTLLRILEEKGELDLEGALADYLPSLHFNDSIDTKSIALRSLLNHTHGTFSNRLAWKTAYLGYSGGNSELIDDLNTDFLYDPSGKFRYSNVGPILAGMVVDEATGNSWKDEMDKYIFEPLKMSNTSAYMSDFDSKDILPSITATKERGIIESGFYKEDITMHASGGILSTVEDLSKWLCANINADETLLSQNGWKDLHTSSTDQNREYFTYERTGYSLGWDVAKYQNQTVLTRFGGLAGISFHISFMPEEKIGIIAFSNDNRAYVLPHLMADYAYNLMNQLPADSIFESEKVRFDKSFEREDAIAYPEESTALEVNNRNDALLGRYHNQQSWPAISIRKEDDCYIFEWGVLNGKIYETEEGHYIAHLGVFERTFEVNNDILVTGSLEFSKEE